MKKKKNGGRGRRMGHDGEEEEYGGRGKNPIFFRSFPFDIVDRICHVIK